MAILKRMSQEEIAETFTHRGWFAFCPVYVADDGDEGMVMSERNWVPTWLMAAAEGYFGLVFTILHAIDPNYEPMWGVRVTGEIEED